MRPLIRQIAMAWPNVFTDKELLRLKRLAAERRSAALREGLLPESLAEEFRTVCLQAQVARQRHPDDVASEFRSFADEKAERIGWRRRYIEASLVGGRPIRLAPIGTDYMPVRCLVVPRVGADWGEVQVVVQPARHDNVTNSTADHIRVITSTTDQKLEALARDLGLQLEQRSYAPFPTRNLAFGK